MQSSKKETSSRLDNLEIVNQVIQRINFEEGILILMEWEEGRNLFSWKWWKTHCTMSASYNLCTHFYSNFFIHVITISSVHVLSTSLRVLLVTTVLGKFCFYKRTYIMLQFIFNEEKPPAYLWNMYLLNYVQIFSVVKHSWIRFFQRKLSEF